MCEIVLAGLPNVGKSSIFKFISGKYSKVGNYPFCTIDPEEAEVIFKDKNLDIVSNISKSKKTVYSTVKIKDVPGLIENSHKGEGLGNKFLSFIKDSDIIYHVVRCFDDSEIVHVSGETNPKKDFEILNYELIMSDISIAEKSIKKSSKEINSLLTKIINHLMLGKMIHHLNLSEIEKKMIKSYNFLTAKPMIVVLNFNERNQKLIEMQEFVEKQGYENILISIKNEYNLNNLIQKCFDKLDLIHFFTTGENESRSWLIKSGSTAKQAAEKIHSYIAKNLIKTEVIEFENFILNNLNKRFEGRNYVIKNNDILFFRFNKS